MRYWINKGSTLRECRRVLSRPEKRSSCAVGKTSGVRAWLPANCHHMLGRVGSIFLPCACEVLGTVRFMFVFAMAKYIIVVCF